MLLIKRSFKLTWQTVSIHTVPVSTLLSLASSSEHKYKAPCSDFASGGQCLCPWTPWISLSEGSGEFSLHPGLECCWETSQSEEHMEKGNLEPIARRVLLKDYFLETPVGKYFLFFGIPPFHSSVLKPDFHPSNKVIEQNDHFTPITSLQHFKL